MLYKISVSTSDGCRNGRQCVLRNICIVAMNSTQCTEMCEEMLALLPHMLLHTLNHLPQALNDESGLPSIALNQLVRPSIPSSIDPRSLHANSPSADNIEWIATYEPHLAHGFFSLGLAHFLCEMIIYSRIWLESLDFFDRDDIFEDGSMGSEVWGGLYRIGDHGLSAIGEYYSGDDGFLRESFQSWRNIRKGG